MEIVRCSFPRLNTLPDVTRRRYEVARNSSRRAVAHPLVSEYAGRAVLLAAHNSNTGTGLIGQFVGVSLEPADDGTNGGRKKFEQALERIKGLGQAMHTTIWLGGASASDERGAGGQGNIAIERSYVQDRITGLSLPLAHLAVEWTIEPNALTHIRLRPQTGVLSLQREAPLPPAPA